MAGSRLATNPDVISDILHYFHPFPGDHNEELESLDLLPTSVQYDKIGSESAGSGHANRRTLLSLACASRIISECALDVLWNRLTTLRDLFNVFPSLQHRRIQDPTGTFRAGPIEWTFTNPDAITTDDWKRFDGYAKRVRVLHLYWGVRRNGINPEVIAHAASRHDGRPLLPALRRLTIEPGQALDRTVLTFLPPTITVLDVQPFYPRTIDIEGRDTHCAGLTHALQHVASTCLYVEDVKVSICGGVEQVLPLSNCSYLRRLNVSWGPVKEGKAFDPRLRVASAKFLHLQTLIVSGRLAPMAQLFQCCPIPALVTLRIEATTETSLEDLVQCLKAFGHDYRSKNCFRHFFLHPSSVSPPPFFGFRIRVGASEWTLADVLRPLCAFPQIETIDLCLLLQWGVYLTHAEVERLVVSWPNLLALRIDLGSRRHYRGISSSLNLIDDDDKTTAMVLERCPKLREFALLF